jgi:hypothetical protein
MSMIFLASTGVIGVVLPVENDDGAAGRRGAAVVGRHCSAVARHLTTDVGPKSRRRHSRSAEARAHRRRREGAG